MVEFSLVIKPAVTMYQEAGRYLMRLMLNKLRLSLTAEVKPEDNPRRVEQALLRGNRSMDKLIASGRIQRFYETNLLEWARREAEKNSHSMRVVVAIGIPKTGNITVHRRTILDRLRGLVCRISIAPDSILADSRLTLAVCALISEATRIDIESIDDEAVYEVLKLAHSARQVKELPIPLYRPRQWKVWYDLTDGVALRRNADGQIALHIEDPEGFAESLDKVQEAESAMMTRLMDPLSGLALTDVATIMGRFSSLMHRMSRYSRHRRGGSGGRWVLWHQADVGGRMGRRKAPTVRTVEVTAELAADNMQCFMTVKPLVAKGASILREELRALLRIEGVVDPFIDELDRVEKEVSKGHAVVARLVAAGKMPVSPERPMLRLAIVAEERAPVALKELLERSVSDIRQLQPKRFVGAGALVAVVDYAIPGVNGRDVLGKELPFRAQVFDDFIAGQGVERRGEIFLAREAGVARIKGNEVLIDKAMQFPGNVDLTPGDIEVPGPLAIGGSVEMGASVVAKGPITIAQAFAGKYLRANGGLTIQGGVQGQRGSVLMVTGDVSIRFMQSGTIRCRGNVVIESNMTGGIIEATGTVTVMDPQGGVFGGQVIAGQTVTAANFGRDGGQTVQVWFGSAVQSVRRRTNLAKRRAELIARLETLERSGIGGAGKLTERAAKRGDRRIVRETMERIGDIVKRLDALLVSLKTETAPSQSHFLEAKGTLARGTMIACDAQNLVVESSVIGVRVVSANSGLVLSAVAEKKADEPAG